MAFGAGVALTTKGKAMIADRVRTTPSTYTTAPKYLGVGVGATGAARTAASSDTALSTEVETRTTCTESVATTTTTGDTTQWVGTVTATATRACDEAGMFDASSAGNMAVSITHAVVSLTTNDAIQHTVKYVYG